MGTNRTNFELAWPVAAPSTAAAFGTIVPVATSPDAADDGVFSLARQGKSFDLVHIIPIGTDAANETYSFRLWGWAPVDHDVDAAVDDLIWIPTLINEFAATLGTTVATAIAADHLVADTIVLTTGDASSRIISPADNTVASVTIDPVGAHFLTIDPKKATAASMNFLVKMF